MSAPDMRTELIALLDRSSGDRRAYAWAALTHDVVLGSGRELTDRGRAEERLQQLVTLVFGGPEGKGEPACRVLLVEDSDAIARAIVTLLGPAFDVVRARDGILAQEHLASGETFDIVLSDVDMPRLDGFGLLRWARAARPALVDRMLFMTADPGLPPARMIALKHVHPVLPKPFTRASLLAAIRAARGEP